ncbi:MAG: DUF2934 domain-containing protein [Bryobacteraceae bacterium]|nr:DUF2934 domain-containing protein [Bryobacteraceae bacterium]
MPTKKKISAKVASQSEVAPLKAEMPAIEAPKKKAAPRAKKVSGEKSSEKTEAKPKVAPARKRAVKAVVETPVVAPAVMMSAEEFHAEVTRVAYGYWVSRGYAPGDPVADWLRAEAEVRARISS